MRENKFKGRPVVLLCLILISGVAAFGQGRDAFYPYTVECSETLVNAGETATFTAKFPEKAVLDKYTFRWSISSGEISEGQGTLSIKVKTEPYHADSSITATMHLGSTGTMYPGSQTTGDCTAKLLPAPKPELVDEISTVDNCEAGSRALQGFISSLANNPSSEGYIVIYTERGKTGSSRQRERELRAAMKLFGGSFDRLRIEIAAFADNAKTEFWLVPPGTLMHDIQPLDLSGVPKSPEPTEPYLYGMESLDGIPECKQENYDVPSYADHLKQNPKYRGRIVIGATTRARFLRKERGIRSTLARRGVAATRVKFVSVKADAGPLSESVELWVIPTKNRAR